MFAIIHLLATFIADLFKPPLPAHAVALHVSAEDGGGDQGLRCWTDGWTAVVSSKACEQALTGALGDRSRSRLRYPPIRKVKKAPDVPRLLRTGAGD
jgi:hypothetical protein